MVNQFEPPEQYFPTYKIESRARFIATKEYEAAVKTLDGEEKIFAATAAVTVVTPGLIASFIAPNIEDTIRSLELFFSRASLFVLLISFSTLIATMFLVYCAEKYKAIVYASRKIIVLRVLLGIDYGKIQWVMPVHRVEGAHDPYAIKMFPGWRSFENFPAILVMIYLSVLNYIICEKFSDQIFAFAGRYSVPIDWVQDFVGMLLPHISWLAATVSVACVAATYRGRLFDLHENWWGVAARLLGRLIRYRVLHESETKIYHLKMAVYEARRMGFNLLDFRRILLHLEDRRFFDHSGVSFRALAAAVYRRARTGKASGGSTISQQLVRSIFVESMTPAWRRKFTEFPMAFWFEACFDKNEILEMYLCCVRYEHKVLGITAAVRYFFPEKKIEPNKPVILKNSEIFFLIERLSNVRSRFLSGKIQQQLSDALINNVISREDAAEIMAIYAKQIESGRVRPTDPNAWERLNAWMNAHKTSG